VLILNPRFIAIVALILGGGYALTHSTGDVKEWKVSAKADEVIAHKTGAIDYAEGEAERVKGGGTVSFGKAYDTVDASTPPPPPEPLTAENLVKEVKKVAADTPAYVPTVPLMGRVAEAMLQEDPSFITFGALAPGVLGEFRSGPNQPPKVVLSTDLRRMHEKGVPVAMIAPVLAHELDHFFWYLAKDIRLAKTHDVEKRAMVSTAAYIEVMKHGGPGGYSANKKKGDGDAVDARAEDAEVSEYYKFLKKVRASLFGGQVDQLVKDHYGK
jgi:hypothetical protein